MYKSGGKGVQRSFLGLKFVIREHFFGGGGVKIFLLPFGELTNSAFLRAISSHVLR